MQVVNPKDITITINLSMLPYNVANTLIELSDGDVDRFSITLVTIIVALSDYLCEHYKED